MDSDVKAAAPAIEFLRRGQALSCARPLQPRYWRSRKVSLCRAARRGGLADRPFRLRQEHAAQHGLWAWPSPAAGVVKVRRRGGGRAQQACGLHAAKRLAHALAHHFTKRRTRPGAARRQVGPAPSDFRPPAGRSATCNGFGTQLPAPALRRYAPARRPGPHLGGGPGWCC